MWSFSLFSSLILHVLLWPKSPLVKAPTTTINTTKKKEKQQIRILSHLTDFREQNWEKEMVGKREDDSGSMRGEGERGQGCVGVIVQWQIMWESHWGKAPTSSWENEIEQWGRQIPFIRSAQVLLQQQRILNLIDMSNNSVTINAVALSFFSILKP